MEIKDKESLSSFSFAMNCVLIVIYLVASWFVGALFFEYVEIPILEGDSSEVGKRIIMQFVLGGFISGLLIMPIISAIVGHHLERLYELNKEKFNAVGKKQSIFEHAFSLVSLLFVIILAVVYALHPHPILLSIGLTFGAILSFVWGLHRQRERQLISTKKQKVVFYVTEYTALLCLSGVFIICHLVLHFNYVSSNPLPQETVRAVVFFQYTEAVILGLFLGLFSEWLSKKLPVMA